ncbi:MAG: hypothetical protein ACFFBP_10775 [Promethearchaeota archaeon]
MLFSDSEKKLKDKKIKKHSNYENKVIRYADYDTENKIFYANFYLPEYEYVLKTILVSIENENFYNEFKFEKFELFKYVYMIFY